MKGICRNLEKKEENRGTWEIFELSLHGTWDPPTAFGRTYFRQIGHQIKILKQVETQLYFEIYFDFSD